jgi:hypothetical protein
VGEGIVKIKGRIDPCHVKFPLVRIKKGAVKDKFTTGGDPLSLWRLKKTLQPQQLHHYESIAFLGEHGFGGIRH